MRPLSLLSSPFRVLRLLAAFLALAVWASVGWFIEHSLLTFDFGAWYGQSSLVAVVLIAALALWAFRTSLGECLSFIGLPLKT